MTIFKGKRPRDPNQLAKWVVDHSTTEEAKPAPGKQPSHTPPENISEYMRTIGRKGGQIGGKRRLKTMTKDERRKIAVKAAKARWSKRDA